MAQRITDILPPKEIKKKEKKIEEISIPKKEVKIKAKRPHIRVFLISIILSIFVIIGLGALGYYFSVGARVIIWPKLDVLSSQIQVIVDKETKDINIFAKTIPGYQFKEEKVISQEFPTTNKILKETKAEGTIRVYNNYSTSPQVLIANTRFISAEGKLFRSLERVVIPGGKYEKGKLQPGYLDIKVRADRPGEEYNIEPSTFSIPGFAGTPKYTGFYAKSFEQMKGGFKGEVYQLTEKDIENAKAILSQRLFEETRKALKEKISSEFILIEEAIRDRVLETTTSPASATQQAVKVEVKGISETLCYKKTDLENFGKETLLFQKPMDKKFHEASLKIDSSLDKVEMDLGKITLNLNISSKIYYDINEEEIKKKITDKTPTQIKEFLSIQPEVERMEIKLLPFWSKKAPKDENKIRIELNLD
jgi:hypothetical protein